MSGKRILVADDSPEVLEILAYMLQEMGHSVLRAKDGIEALCLVERESVDLIVTDIQMPRMDGLEFIKTMKEQPCLRDIPVIVITAGDDQEALAAGCHAVLRKPFRVRDFSAAITRAVNEGCRGADTSGLKTIC